VISFVFGFGLSGPSSISVPVLVRVARMPEALRTSLLFESVVTDLLQLLVPLILIGLLVSGNFSTVHISGILALTLGGSIVAGVAAAVFWLWVLDRIGPVGLAYSWTLTITMVLATYGLADYLGLSAAISIFVFGLMIGNRKHLEFDPWAKRSALAPAGRKALSAVRRTLRLSAEGVDIQHIQQVQKEVSFFASAFFFVYIGLLFQTGGLTLLVLVVPLAASFVMLVLRFVYSPVLAVYLSKEPTARRSERALLSFNIPRGLAAAIIATIPISYGLVIPGFLDAMFLGILFSTVLSTVGIFLYYRPGAPAGPVAELAAEPHLWELPPSADASPKEPASEPPRTPGDVPPARPPLPPARPSSGRG
jgi:cell volume regulation protein A